jgi:hypothetical protein
MYRVDTSQDLSRETASRQISREHSRRTLTAMAAARPVLELRARAVVDYSLARRSTLAELAAGRLDRREVCDAQTYLVRAARYHGQRGEGVCPGCGGAGLAHVSYTFGDCFRSDTNGRARHTRELLALADEVDEFTAYVVEVCADCRWNHLLASYVLGTGVPVKRRARS